MHKPIYVLGTSMSHDGSTCLLKDGKIFAAIEKERITRKKHDGGDDAEAIRYCLEKANITLQDLDLIVQNAPSAGGEFDGPRIFHKDCPAPVITIPHHLAHAYSAFGTSPFEECAVLVIDGTGNTLDKCTDLSGDALLLNRHIPAEEYNRHFENNSYYHFKYNYGTLVCKEAARLYNWQEEKISLYTENSIGDFYGCMSIYCFRSMFDAGKLMGLAPYGDPSVYNYEAFHIQDEAILLDHEVFKKFSEPAASHADFKKRFQYYADVANWAQRELERAVIHIINSRYKMYPSENLAYAGGVALNAVVNGKILDKCPFKRLYIQPASGDNGVSLGCAYYGWLQVLKGERMLHDSSTCFGKIYDTASAKESLRDFHRKDPVLIKKGIDAFFRRINKNFRQEKLRKDNVIVQFNIKNSGTYQVGLGRNGVMSKNDIFGRPTSEVTIANTDFHDALGDPIYFGRLLQEGKLGITSFDELNYLIEVVDFDLTAGKIEAEKPQAHLQYIHYEGEDYIQEAARLLSKGMIIGWFQDESEFGPRALGRRSILADPRKKGTRDLINSEIKFREDFRPFAPSVLREDVSSYFETDRDGPYMLTVNKARREWAEKINEVVHVDGTCRIQTVTPDWSPKYDLLIREFKKLTGISVLLNTSFNGMGMPIVETPDDALRFFYSGKLDYLVIQDLIIKRQVSRQRPASRVELSSLPEPRGQEA